MLPSQQRRQAWEEASSRRWLSEIEEQVLSYIHRYQDKTGNMPGISTIQKGLGITEYKARKAVLSLSDKKLIEYKVRRWFSGRLK